MKFQRLGGHPFAVFIITSVLSDFTDIDFGIEVGSKCLMMVTGIAIHNIQIMHFIKVVFSSIRRIDAAYTRIETATENSCQAGFFKTLLVSPLPTVFEVSFIFRFIIGSIQIIHSGFQAGFHDGKILIRQGYINNDFGFETIKKLYQFIYIVCINLSCFNSRITDCFNDCITF